MSRGSLDVTLDLDATDDVLSFTLGDFSNRFFVVLTCLLVNVELLEDVSIDVVLRRTAEDVWSVCIELEIITVVASVGANVLLRWVRPAGLVAEHFGFDVVLRG